ncbi:hypothetical protein KQI52_02330 [bacterium]|nr:hypothetical protein [bacterium]
MKARLLFGLIFTLVLCIQLSPVTANAQLFAGYIELYFNDANASAQASIPDLTSNQYSEIWFDYCDVNNLYSDSDVRAIICMSSCRHWDVDAQDELAIPAYHEYPTSGGYYRLEWLGSPTYGLAVFDLWIDIYPY